MSDAATCPPSSIPIHILSALAGTLQETAQALLAFCSSTSNETSEPEEDTGTEAPLESNPAKPLGEERCYRLPAYIVREEGELLARYRAENFADALSAIHSDLYVTAFLMQGYDGMDDVDSFHLHLIGEHLARSLDMLSKACSMFADFDLLRISPAA